MFNIAICDDDIQAVGEMELLVQNIAQSHLVDVEIEVFCDGRGLADAVKGGNAFDIIYLDIEMEKEGGNSTAKRVRQYDKNVLIIFVTAHENYMRESFVVRPFRYLVKPVNEQVMDECFKAAYDDISNGDFYFRYHYQRTSRKIPVRDILYFESNKRKVVIVTANETYELYGKLNEIEESLKTCKTFFLRVHQSFLVNYKHVSEQTYEFVVMDNGRKIPISECRRRVISEQYCFMEVPLYVNG